MTEDEKLLMEADSVLSLIRNRESRSLTRQTVEDLDNLLPRLRVRTSQIKE